VQMFGLFSAASNAASRSKRARWSRSPVNVPGQRLDRDVTTESKVARSVDLPHAAHTYAGDDFIVAEPRARRKRHVAAILTGSTNSDSSPP
jgi:hypothetical protein